MKRPTVGADGQLWGRRRNTTTCSSSMRITFGLCRELGCSASLRRTEKFWSLVGVAWRTGGIDLPQRQEGGTNSAGVATHQKIIVKYPALLNCAALIVDGNTSTDAES